MKLFRLLVHQKNFSEEDLIINPKDLPEAKRGDIVEIYHPPPENEKGKKGVEEFPRLLLQIKSLSEDLQSRDTLSVEQSIANTFLLKIYNNVSVRIVNPADVALDSIELTFKDQYMGRSEMWRLKNHLTNTCMYMNKKIEFCGGAIRCQVYEMWAQGERVACGVLTEDTKIVFRSSTSMVYLFLQMSSEMWDFDIYGDLYFEKAVHGFLANLFTKWKKHGSNHEVTIVLFSRTFYEASSLEEFPLHMRECLQRDYKGRFYEDFYRVAVQNERYDDWCGILVQLRKIFSEYLNIVLEYHARPNVIIPAATNSTAAQGNFLEVLNMSLNVFEKHYLERSFDRTGQLSVVITPGVGVFEVDRELTNITKQRIIDNGVGSDLVCVGEQPLHAVPLLKLEVGKKISCSQFHNKDAQDNVPDDYSMPHWINLSFYSTNKKIPYSNFIPRIKLPPMTNKVKKKTVTEDEYIHNSFFDYDAYDAQIFQMPPAHSVHEMHTIQNKLSHRYKRSSGSLLNGHEVAKFKRKLSDPDIQQKANSNARSEPIAIPPALVSPVISPLNDMDRDKELSPPYRMVVGSEGSPPLESRALINPFDPSHVTIKLTSNRRRWTHIFPKGPTGVLIQQHHYQAVPAQQHVGDRQKNSKGSSESSENSVVAQKSFCMTEALHEYLKKKPNPHISGSNTSRNASKSLTFLWGATGEQEWTPALSTGVDWKSLTISACLPITTDYFPDERALNIDYVVSLYSLVPDSVSADFAQQRPTYRKLLTTEEVFLELISQRLAQGFQLIVMDNIEKLNSTLTPKQSVVRTSVTQNDQSYYLSIGRLFHKISLSGNAISVTRYRPRHPYPGFKYQYRYRFHAPHHDTYEESYASFTTEKLEHYNWNYLDHYICTGGDSEFVLVDALKYWRFRVYLLPLSNPAKKKVIEGSSHHDIYDLPSNTDYQIMVDGFVKFLETAINKIKRSQICKKPRMSLNIVNNTPLLQPRRNSMSNFFQNANNSSPFRERMDSNRLPDRPRLRSGSKVDRTRTVPATQDNATVESQNSDGFLEDSLLQSGPILKPTATNQEIIEAMKHPINGLSFIYMQQNLPNYTFVAAEAVTWLMARMEGSLSNEKAVQILQGLLNEQLISHASGHKSRIFQFGYFLFYICLPTEKDDKDTFQPNGDLSSFENEWLEVEIKPALHWGIQQTPINLNPAIYSTGEYGVPHFLCEDINVDYAEEDGKGLLFKRIRLETDVANKSDRVEWGHVKYQTVFRPDQAYEFIIEWLTSSGPIIGDLLNSWNRKAQSCGLQMVPIPHDPLALPFSNKSDPLRGPIFIPLNINDLQKDEQLFKDFPEDTASERLFLFQEAIVQRFGFVNCQIETSNSSSASKEHQYVHCTGTVFILFSCTTTRSRSRVTSLSKGKASKRYSVHADVVPSPHEAYITRHVSGKNKDDYDNSRKLGYLWSWNHMISKRWRSSPAIDNNYPIKMLKDFKAFCANTDNRLQQFLEECWEKKVVASTKNIL